MVLPIKGLWLIFAMALVWAGTCGGMSIMIDYKTGRRRAMTICALIFTLIYLVSVLFSFLLGNKWFDLWRPLSLLLPLLVFKFLSSDGMAKIFFICFSQLNVCGVIVVITGLAASQFANPEPVLLLLLLITNGGMIWLYIKKLRTPIRAIVNSISAHSASLVFLPVAFAATFMLLIEISSTLSGITMKLAYAAAFITFATLGLCYCIIYQNLLQGEALHRASDNEKFLKIQLRRQQEEMEMFENARQTAVRFRHDIRHHANIILRLIDDCKSEKASCYIRSLIKDSETGTVKRWCANDTVNAILSIYTERAQQYGISVTVEAIIPSSLGVDEMELASIYANSIENATEACSTVHPETERWINVYTEYKDGKLILQVKNSCSDGSVKFDEFGMPLSSKKNGGTGTRNIRYVVEKHDGTWFFEAKKGVFITSIVIPGV